MRECKCGLCKCCVPKPSSFVYDILAKNLIRNPSPASDIALSNVLKVIVTEEQPVKDIKALQKHPAFLTGSEMMTMIKKLREVLNKNMKNLQSLNVEDSRNI